MSLPVKISEHHIVSDPFAEIWREVKVGLTSIPKMLNPKYFYDERGSQLFDDITNLPEYYPTRTETAILRSESKNLIEKYRPEALFELGSGSATKTQLLLDEMEMIGLLNGIGLFDINEEFLSQSAADFQGKYPKSTVRGYVGDFTKEFKFDGFDFSPTLYIFLGSTIGNMSYTESEKFLCRVADKMGDGDFFLLGIDLIKDENILHAAYNDSQGVTAEFNKNMLTVINNRLNGDFNPALFEHEAIYNIEEGRIEMYLRSLVEQEINLKEIDLKVNFSLDEKICTEISRKYTREKVESLLDSADMEIAEWLTDEKSFFAVALARLSTTYSVTN